MRGQGLPITAIIIAALGVLVLIILAAVFSGQIGKIVRVTQECTGTCVDPVDFDEERSPGSKCPYGFTEASGRYIQRGQEGVEPSERRYCSSCCISIG